MPSSLMVRSLARADFAQWQPLWQGYNLFYGRPALPDEITQMTWSRFFDAYEPVYALVAEKDGQLLGLAHYLFHRSTTSIEPVCYLQDLFTNEAARGQGIGRALIEAVYERARIGGSTRVYWQTQENNATARSLYDKVAELSGFIVYRKQV
jgi:GNAT superfamily N-acetyltransferase